MKIDVTIDDPKAYTAPFTVRVNQKLMVDERVDAELIEFICAENEKDVEQDEVPQVAGCSRDLDRAAAVHRPGSRSGTW